MLARFLLGAAQAPGVNAQPIYKNVEAVIFFDFETLAQAPTQDTAQALTQKRGILMVLAPNWDVKIFPAVVTKIRISELHVFLASQN
jgi:hypothetical protein